MQMEHMPGWLWPIVTLGAAGAFIDFLMGRAGQDRARDLLTRWWVRFDDVHWDNFGRKEALFAISILDRLAGKTIIDLRRWIFISIVLIILATAAYIVQQLVNVPHFRFLTSQKTESLYTINFATILAVF
jgi:hypothetical protein